MTSVMTSVMTSRHDGRHDVKPFLATPLAAAIIPSLLLTPHAPK